MAHMARGRKSVVINADSAQVYADLAVLSARPTADEMQGIEHRLFGEWDGAAACSAADWAARASTVISEVHASGGLPIVVGGTGLYLNTLLAGIAPVPKIDPGVRTEVRAMAVTEAYAALQGDDPGRAAQLSPNDKARVSRALEVVRSTGRSMNDWQRERSDGIGSQIDLHAIVLLPVRGWLYERCDRRFGQMLEQGAVAEVQRLLDRKLDPDLPVMRAIGVSEVAALLAGNCTREETETRGSKATRNYAKRQYTWFRNQPPPEWQRATSHDYDIETIFASLLRD